jgi:hypothetical protein
MLQSLYAWEKSPHWVVLRVCLDITQKREVPFCSQHWKDYYQFFFHPCLVCGIWHMLGRTEIYRVMVGSPEGEYSLEDLGICESIQAEFCWARTAPNGRLL